MLASLVATVILSACSEKDKPTSKEGSNSSFIIDFDKSKVTEFREIRLNPDDNDPNGFSPQKQMTVQICLKDIAESKTVPQSSFKVSARQISFNKTTNTLGCLVWKELVEVDPLDNDKVIIMKRLIEPLEKHIGQVAFELSLNPSKDENSIVITPIEASTAQNEDEKIQYKSGELMQKENGTKTYTKTYDVYVNLVEFNKSTIANSDKRETVVNSLILNSEGIRYEDLSVDQNLNLIFPYAYQTELNIALIKQNISDVAEAKIKKGNFLFQLVFVKSEADLKSIQAKDVYAATEFKAQAKGDQGLILQNIVVNFDNIPALSNRMRVIFTISSIDKKPLFVDQNFQGIVNGISANQKLAITLVPSEVNGHDLYNKYVVKNANKEKSNLDIDQVLKDEGFWPLARQTDTVKSLLKASASYSLSSGRNLAEIREICSLIFGDSSDKTVKKAQEQCSGDEKWSWGSTLVIEPREYVKKVHGRIGTPTILPSEEFTLNSKFNMNRVTNVAAGADAKLLLGVEPVEYDPATASKENPLDLKARILSYLFGRIKYGVSGNVFVSTSFKTDKSNENNIAGGVVEKLISNQVVVNLDVETYKCLVFSVNEKTQETLKNSSYSPERYICGEGRRQTIPEQYFLVNQIRNGSSNSVIDQYASAANPMKMMIRGNRIYDSFRAVLASKWTFEWGLMNGQENSSFMTEEAPLLLSREQSIRVGK